MLSKFCNCTRLLKIKNNIYILWEFLIKQLFQSQFGATRLVDLVPSKIQSALVQ